MPLPAPVEALWNDLQSVRARLLREVEGLSQAQADWRTSDQDWSVGEIVHHLTLAEIGTGKVTSKVLRDAGETVKPFPPDLKAFAPLSTPAGGRADAPQAVWPEHVLRQLVESTIRDCRVVEKHVAIRRADIAVSDSVVHRDQMR